MSLQVSTRNAVHHTVAIFIFAVIAILIHMFTYDPVEEPSLQPQYAVQQAAPAHSVTAKL